LKKLDTHQIQADEYDDAPEWTDAMFEQADLVHHGVVIKKASGRPKKENPKMAVKLRIDPDVLEAFKATGKGWQTRMHDVLRMHMPH
jgi:uncharacterized protein (DUF4415 family)